MIRNNILIILTRYEQYCTKGKLFSINEDLQGYRNIHVRYSECTCALFWKYKCVIPNVHVHYSECTCALFWMYISVILNVHLCDSECASALFWMYSHYQLQYVLHVQLCCSPLWCNIFALFDFSVNLIIFTFLFWYKLVCQMRQTSQQVYYIYLLFVGILF